MFIGNPAIVLRSLSFSSLCGLFEPLKVLLQKGLKNETKFCWHWTMIPKHLTDTESIQRGIELLPLKKLVSDYIATPLRLYWSLRLKIQILSFYKKNVRKKQYQSTTIVSMHTSGFKPATARERERVVLNRCALRFA